MKNSRNSMKKNATSVPTADRTKPPLNDATLCSTACAALVSHS